VPHESPWVVTVPLILLAIPSIVIGFLTAGPMLFGTDMLGHAKQLPFFLGAIDVPAARDVLAKLAAEAWHGPVKFALHGFVAPTFWLAFAGFALATVMYWWKPELHHRARRLFALPVRILENKYGFDDLWIGGFAGGGVRLGKASRAGDEKLIDGLFVNGSARLVAFGAGLLRRTQSGYLYHYAFAMILGLIALLAVLIRYWH
jgi:NADH-quinone oxidoreductase subunit L